MLSPYISNNVKQTIKEKIIGKEKLLIMQELYQTRKITNNYNQKTLPETEFTKIFFDKFSLRKFDLKTTPAVNNQMFVKPETTTFYLEYIESNILILSNVGKFVFLDGFSFMNNEIDESINPKIEFEEEFFKILDVLIIKNKIYFSYAKKVEDGCYKLGLMSSEYNEKKMILL